MKYSETNSIHNPDLKLSDGDISCIINVFAFPKYEDYEWDDISERDYKDGVLAHNTSIQNVPSIIKHGVKYDAEGQYHSNDFIWAVNLQTWNKTSSRKENSGYMEAPRGYGGTTILIDPTPYRVEKLNSDEFGILDNVSVNNIIAIDLQMGDYDTQGYGKLSDMPSLIKEYGIDKVKEVMLKHHASELTDEQVIKLIDWANENID